MVKHQTEYWDGMYGKALAQLPLYDGWLDEYVPMLKQCKRIVDLGCGLGVNTYYLHSIGIETIACDFSQTALDGLLGLLPGTQTLCFDMTQGLPFSQESVDVVIADLSLHYFSDSVTRKVINDIHTALRPGGLLLCRVNAYEDGFDPSAYEMLEPDYFVLNDCTKRFFTQHTLREYFQNWQIVKVAEYNTEKYGFVKPVIFAEVKKKRYTIGDKKCGAGRRKMGIISLACG